MHKVKAVY